MDHEIILLFIGKLTHLGMQLVNVQIPVCVWMIFILLQYNGCVWKGGRLKLEKAKQFYLDKLRQEWEERDLLNEKEETEASRTSSITQTKGLPQLDQSRDLEIYFPGLRKVT